MQPKTYTLQQVAEIMQCTYLTAWRRVNRGDLDSIRDGRVIRVTESQLQEYFYRFRRK